MMLFQAVTVLLFLTFDYSANSERVRLEAKKLIKGKVIANGISIPAKSLAHCLSQCNLKKRSCDGIVYHEIIKKCRLINKCTPTYQVDNTSNVVYYSRRPRILVPGFEYDVKSDTCIGLVKVNGNYAQADGFCRKQNAHLAVINQKKLNQIASNMLLHSQVKWAWINDENIVRGVTVKPHGTLGNEVLPEEVFSPEIVQWRNNSYRSCWGLNDRGQWGQYSCKNKTMMALCQVQPFAL